MLSQTSWSSLVFALNSSTKPTLDSLPVVCRVCGEVVTRREELAVVARKWPPVVALHEKCLREAQRGLHGAYQYGIVPFILNRRGARFLFWGLLAAILGVGALGAVLESSPAPFLATLPMVAALAIPAMVTRSIVRRVPE
ncbi:MAG: hypothetical protein AB8H86_06725 [Polyangiales bacterium]